MSDEMQRTMQFILEQQAQFVVNQQKIEERVTKLEVNLGEIAQAQADLSRAQADLARSQAEMVRTQTHMNEVVAVMADTHTHTEEKLDAFIGVLERYISSGRSGGSSEHGET